MSSKYVTWDDIVEIQRGNSQHWPPEGIDASVRDDWEIRKDTCGTSHKKAGPKCRQVIWWGFKKNDPIEDCSLCPKYEGDVNPNPPENHDKCLIVYGLMGTLEDDRFIRRENGTWIFDHQAFVENVKTVAESGANAIRIFAWGVWGARPDGKASQFCPFVLDGNKWDLSRYNDYYFPIVKYVIETANAYGLKVILDLLDQCEIMFGSWNQYSPWIENTQGTAGLYDADAYPYIKEFMRRCADEFSGLNIQWSFGNEMFYRDAIALAKNTWFPVIKEKGWKPENLNFGANMTRVPYDPTTGKYSGPTTVQDLIRGEYENYFCEADKFKVTREVHNCGAFMGPDTYLDQALTWWARKSWEFNIGPALVSDDGEWQGDSQCDWVMYQGNAQRRPSADQWKATCREAWGRADNFSVEHCPKAMRDMECVKNTFRAISEVYKEKYGKYPDNYRG